MDLTVIYSKTSKGSRLRSTFFGGLSSQLKRVLALIDGKSNVRHILAQLDDVSEHKLTLDLTQLENDGYIKQVPLTVSEDWLRVSIFSPMVVEEFSYVEEIEAKAERALKLEAEQKARARMEDEIQAREVVDQIRAKEKAKAEEKYRIDAERKAKKDAELQKVAELKALDDAEKTRLAEQVALEVKAEENIRTAELARIEKKRIAIEQEELRKKTEAESLALSQEKNRLEAESRHKAVLSVIKALEDAEQKRIKAEAEDKIRADEVARIEAENAAREQEEVRKKIEAEALAKAEEEERIEKERFTLEQEELRKIAEADALAKTAEKSRLDTERKQKQHAEIQQKAEIKAREALEKIRSKEQEDMRAAELKARKKSEEEARARAEEIARLETEYIAQQEAEARLKLEVVARVEAEYARVAAEAEAEEKAKAEELKRIEIERNMREAEELLKIAEADARAKIEEDVRLEEKRIASEKAEAEAKHKAQIKSKIKADEKARKEAERIAMKEEKKVALAIQEKIRQESNKQDLAETQRLVSAAENEKPKVSERTKPTARTLSLSKWILLASKAMLVYLPLFALLLVGLLHLINLSLLVNPIQKLASEVIGEPVLVHEVHASLWPEPHLTLNDVEVGDSSSLKNEALKVDSVYIAPSISTLFENVKVVDSLKFSGINLEQGVDTKVLQWANSASRAEHIKIKRINFNQVNIKILDLSLGPLEGEITLDESRGLTSISMTNSDHGLSMQLSPKGDGFNIFLTATHWPLPFSQKIVFDELKARGSINADRLNFSQIDGSIYGGNITAGAIVSWSNQWVTAGNFSLSQASTLQFLKAFASDGDIEGKLSIKGSFAGTSGAAAKLISESEINSNFEIRNGKINGVDLERAILSSSDKSLSGDTTDFNKLTGALKVKDGLFQFKKLLLIAPQLQAQGNLDIQPNQDISGNISASLVAQSRRLQARFDLAGTVNNVKQR